MLAPPDLISLINFITQDHLPRSGATHSGRHHSTTIQSSVKTMTQSDGDIVSTKVPSSQTTLAYAKLTKPKEQSKYPLKVPLVKALIGRKVLEPSGICQA